MVSNSRIFTHPAPFIGWADKVSINRQGGENSWDNPNNLNKKLFESSQFAVRNPLQDGWRCCPPARGSR